MFILPWDDQSTGIYPGAFRCRGPIPKGREGQADRCNRVIRDAHRAGREVRGLVDLAAYLATSGEAHSAFVQQLFHYLIKQPIGAFGPQELPELRRIFAAHDFNIRKLTIEIMASSALTPRREKL